MKLSTIFVAFAGVVGTAYAVCEDSPGYQLCTDGLTIGDENCCDSPNDGRVGFLLNRRYRSEADRDCQYCCTQKVPCVASNGDVSTHPNIAIPR